MNLYHYFEKSRGPFLTVSDLSDENAVSVFSDIQNTNPSLVPPDIKWFLTRRRELENTVRQLFIKKGGEPKRRFPHYMTVEIADSMKAWYIEPEYLKIGIDEFDLKTVSFTYGDMFPVFNPKLNDDSEYRFNVYRYDEITEIIKKYGYPQETENIQNAPVQHLLKYVEAHIWSDEIVEKYRYRWLSTNRNEEEMF